MSQPSRRHGLVSTTTSSSSSSAKQTMKSTVGRWNSLPSPQSGLSSLLSYLLVGGLYCCIVAGQLEPNRVDLMATTAVVAGAAKAMKQDATYQINDDKISLDQRNLILLLALREFCANNPLECKSDDPVTCNPSAKQTTDGDSANGEELSILRSVQERGNRTSGQSAGWDELAEDQSIWLPKLSSVESERDVGIQTNQEISTSRWQRHPAANRVEFSDDIGKILLNALERYEASIYDDSGLGAPSTSGVHGKSTRAGRKFKRDRELRREQPQHQKRRSQQQQQQRYRNEVAGKRQAENNKQTQHRLTVEEAKRIIRAFRRARAGLVATPSAGRALPDTGNGLIGRKDDLRVVPKRTGSSGDEMRPGGDGGSGGGGGDDDDDGGEPRKFTGSIITTKASGFQPELATLDGLTATLSSSDAGGAETDSDDDSLQCNMRRFVYRATKVDRAGNQCTGLITANICYGACDTGEIADWLFPHKRPIHKVCRHGARIRRMKRLTECVTSSGLNLALDGASDEGPLLELQQYHYVDALDCVCRRCTSADTTCLGTMSRPSLPTRESETTKTTTNNQKYRQQISSLDFD